MFFAIVLIMGMSDNACTDKTLTLVRASTEERYEILRKEVADKLKLKEKRSNLSSIVDKNEKKEAKHSIDNLETSATFLRASYKKDKEVAKVALGKVDLNAKINIGSQKVSTAEFILRATSVPKDPDKRQEDKATLDIVRACCDDNLGENKVATDVIKEEVKAKPAFKKKLASARVQVTHLGNENPGLYELIYDEKPEHDKAYYVGLMKELMDKGTKKEDKKAHCEAIEACTREDWEEGDLNEVKFEDREFSIENGKIKIADWLKDDIYSEKPKHDKAYYVGLMKELIDEETKKEKKKEIYNTIEACTIEDWEEGDLNEVKFEDQAFSIENGKIKIAIWVKGFYTL